MAPKLSPIGTQFTVIQVTNNEQSHAVVTPLSDGRFVVVYESYTTASGTDGNVLGQFVNANGTLSSGTINVQVGSGLQRESAVAARSDGGFTTVWQDFGTVTGSPIADPDIYYGITDRAGGQDLFRTLLMNSASPLGLPDIASMADSRQIVVAERDTDTNNSQIVYDVLDADGTTQLFAGVEFGFVASAAGTKKQSPQVAGGPSRALAVFQDNNGESNANEFHISAALFNEATNTFGSPVLIADAGTGHTKNFPDVAYIGDGRFVVVYQLDSQSIWARISLKACRAARAA